MALCLEAVQLRLFLLTCCCKLLPPWLCFDGKAASDLWGSCNRKEILPWILSASSSAPLPFLSQTWHGNDSFILMCDNQVLLGGLCGGRHHLDLCQSRTCIVWAVLFVTIPWYFPGPLLPYIFSMQWVVTLLVLWLPIPVLCPMPNRQTVVEVGCCSQWLGYRLHNFLNLTAQPHAIAGTVEELCPAGCCPWLCKSTCSCDQPSKEMQWEASSSWQTPSTFVGEEGEGTRGRDTNFVICVCLSIAALLAWTLLGFMKSQNQLEYPL